MGARPRGHLGSAAAAAAAMLYLVGLGLGDARDITLRGLDAVKSSARVYLEGYTAVFPGGYGDGAAAVGPAAAADVAGVVAGGTDKLGAMEELYGKKIELADREFVESRSDEMLAQTEPEADGGELNVTMLVVGDPLCATTHVDLMLRAQERGTKVAVVHNASIVNAVGTCGLSVYRYGEAVSIVFFTDTWKPDSFYDKIHANRARKDNALHTLCLLDIQVKEYDAKAMERGAMRRNPPRFMDVHRAARQLLDVEARRGLGAYDGDTLAVGLARVGARDQAVVVGTLAEFARGSAAARADAAAREEADDDLDEEERERLELGRFDEGALGGPLHSLVLCGTLSDVERQALDRLPAVKT